MKTEVSKKDGGVYGFIAGYLVAFVITLFAFGILGWPAFIIPIPFGLVVASIGWLYPKTMKVIAFVLAFIPIP